MEGRSKNRQRRNNFEEENQKDICSRIVRYTTRFNGIRTYFENFGEVKKLRLAYDDIGNNIHRGFGSDTFNNEEDAVDKICEFGSHEINGRY